MDSERITVDQSKTIEDLQREVERLRQQLADSEEAFRAIREGEIDALVVSTQEGEQVFTLQGADQPYRLMVETMSEGALTLLADTTVVYCNHRIAELLEVNLESLPAKSILDFVEKSNREGFQAFIQRGTQKPVQREINLVSKTGKMVSVLLSASPIKVGPSEQPGISMLVADISEQKMYLDVLNNEWQSSRILEQAGNGIVVCNRKGEIIRANKEAARLAGRLPLYLEFTKAFPLQIQDSGEEVPFPIDKVRKGKSLHGMHGILPGQARRGKNSPRHLLVNANPLIGRSLELVGSVISLTDITERIATEELLAYQAGLLDNIHDAVIGTDKDFNITYWNKAAEKLYGWTTSDVIGKSLKEIRLTHMSSSSLNAILQSIQESGQYTGELFHHDRSGDPLVVSGNIVPLYDERGEIRGYVSANRDITARYLAEASLRENQERLKITTEATEIGTWKWDLVEDKIYWDDPLRALLGVDPETKPSYANYIACIHPEEKALVDRTIHQTLADHSYFDVEYRVVWPDGSVHWINSRGKGIYDSEDNPISMMGVAFDISQRKQAERELVTRRAQAQVQHSLMDLREHERMQIARDLHDGPLQELIAISFALQGTIADTKDQALQETLRQIQSSLLAQISEMRAYAGELRPPSLSAFGLEFAIQSHIESFREKHPELTYKLDLEAIGLSLPEPVRLAFYRIYQESMNNVLRHAHATEVKIQLHKTDDQLEMVIKDNGDGFAVPTDWVEQARLGHLGLVGIHERADAVGGTIVIESEADKGTRLIVRIAMEDQAGNRTTS